MTWEVEDGTKLLRRIKVWNALGDREWEETREYGSVGGRALLESRRRSIPGGEMTEWLGWSVDPIDEADFMGVPR